MPILRAAAPGLIGAWVCICGGAMMRGDIVRLANPCWPKTGDDGSFIGLFAGAIANVSASWRAAGDRP